MIETRFKKTDIGEVPEDWDIKMLGEIAPLQRGFDLPTSTLQNGVVPVIYSNGICNFHNRGICKAPGLVTGRSGTIGKFTFLSSGYYWPHNTTLWVTSFNNNSPLFVYYLYSFQKIEEFSSGSGVPTLNRNDVHKKRIPVPPFIEQQRIATVLSDIDALLSNLNKKVEKKKLIKQGVMQQLLTGEKRLEGFNKPWIEKRLGDMSTMNSGGTPSSRVQAFYNGGIPFLSISDMTAQGKYIYSTEKKISELGLINSSARIVNEGTILYAMYASLGKCSISAIRMAISQAVLGINVNTAILDNAFLYYYLSFIENKVVAMGQTGTQSNLSKELVQNFVLKIPVDLTEQIAIATILSDMDAEIEALETKRTKYEQVKQGMMQQLLTGKIRLID